MWPWVRFSAPWCKLTHKPAHRWSPLYALPPKGSPGPFICGLLGSMTIRVQSRLLLLPEEVGQPAPSIPDLTNALVRLEMVGTGGGSPGKGVCCPASWPKFNPWSSHGERRKLTPVVPWPTHVCLTKYRIVPDLLHSFWDMDIHIKKV